MGRPKRVDNATVISAKVDATVRERIRHMAGERNLTSSALVEKVLTAFVAADDFVFDAPRGYADGTRLQLAKLVLAHSIAGSTDD